MGEKRFVKAQIILFLVVLGIWCSSFAVYAAQAERSSSDNTGKAAVVNTVKFYRSSGKKEYTLLRRKVRNGTIITIPSAKKSGYRFLGWAVRKKTSTVAVRSGQRFQVTANMKFYAVFRKKTGGSSSGTGSGDSGNYVYLKKNSGKNWTVLRWKKNLKFPEAAGSGRCTVIGWSRKKNSSVADYAFGTAIPSPGTYYMTVVRTKNRKVNAGAVGVSSRYSFVYVIGDSRCYFMKKALGGNPQNAQIIAKRGAGYQWLAASGGGADILKRRLRARAGTAEGKNPAVIISMGVNDPYNGTAYASFAIKLAAELEKDYNCKVFFTTVGPLNGAMYMKISGNYVRNSEAVLEFNSTLKKKLDGSGVGIIDLYTMMTGHSWATIIGKYHEADGLHYTPDVSLQNYNYFIQCIDAL